MVVQFREPPAFGNRAQKFGWQSARLLVALPPTSDLLLCAKHLFIAAMALRAWGSREGGQFDPAQLNTWPALPRLGSSNQSIKFFQGRNGRPDKDLTRMPYVNPTVTACD
jgi:hypothetical protein